MEHLSTLTNKLTKLKKQNKTKHKHFLNILQVISVFVRNLSFNLFAGFAELFWGCLGASQVLQVSFWYWGNDTTKDNLYV